ncbi:MAG: glutamine--fructose-6-phosphate transaminase (isomerizing) [Tenericutes bacterium]|nr:glutamine--fructose-6-phosphate transaminase (isomerizing) [Mycoplasmatota bacterium]
MCGIVGYKGKRKVKDVLISGLETLEYRGYDSSGIAVLEKNKIRVIKSVGKIEDLKKKLKMYYLDNATCGISHTRWATHGEVSVENSHPHKVGRVCLVHNGIVENYKDIEKELSGKYSFKSQTDSERICALIDSLYNGENEIEAITKAIEILKGSYALAIMFDNKDKIYGVKKDAPLVLGIGDKEFFLASDISAILSYTKEHIILEDNEIVEIGNKFDIYFKEVIIYKKVSLASWNIEEAQKGGYEHFMLKEIEEQEELAKKLYSKYIENDNFSDIVINLSKYNRVDFVGCGSAYNASLIGKYFADKYCVKSDFYVNAYVASEYRYMNHCYDPKVLVVLLSQSGETADTLACLRMCNEEGVDTLAIVNTVSSTMAHEAKYVMPMLAGPEICVATTKGYFSQSYLCSLLILKYMYSTRIINKEERDKIFEEFKKLSKYIKNIIKETNYKEVAKALYKSEDVYFIGRGVDIYSCYEASLKLKETSYIHSECFPAGELKHGPIALISKNTPLVAFLTEFSVREKTISNIMEAKSRGAKIIVIRKESITIDKTICDYEIVIPLTSEYIQNLLAIVCFQLISYEVAKLRKCDIDKPRNLAKSVTVE